MPIRVISVMEAESVTGPAKNLLSFAKLSAEVEMSVVAYRRGQQPESAFVRAALDAGIPADVLWEKGPYDAGVLRQLRELVQRRNPDIVQTHNVKSHLLLQLSGIWKSRPWVAFHHGYTAEDLKMRLYNLTARWSLRAADRVVTVCGPFADQLAAQGVPRARISVLHNSVQRATPSDRVALAAARARIPAPEGSRLLICVGRLSSEKGQADLLEATAELRQTQPNIHLVILGDGIDRGSLERLRTARNLDAHVTFLGFQPDVGPYFGLADAVVLPSHSEGSPNVLLEAMAAGCAIVATQVGGVPEIVRDQETALLVPPHSPSSVAAAASSLLQDPDLARRLGQNARQLAETHYSPEAYRSALVAIYKEVIRDAGANSA